jgi:phospholipase/carboxylesterase
MMNKSFRSHFIQSKKPSDFLMIVLHGKGDSLRPFKSLQNELKLPDVNFLLLNADKKFLGGYSWYGEPPYQRPGVERIREKIFSLLENLEKQGWASKNIFLLGFSQGCLVSTDIALHYKKPLAGVVGVSGYFNFTPRWRNSVSKLAKKTPWLLTHGHKDDILPLEDTKYGVDKLKQIGLKIDWVESNKAHVFEDEDFPIIRKWVKNQMSSL